LDYQDAPDADKFEPDVAATLLDQICARWGLTVAAEKVEALNTLLLTFGKHGTSDRLDCDFSIPIGAGGRGNMMIVAEVLGRRFRRFARVHFYRYMQLLAENNDLAVRMAAIWGYDIQFATIACDFHDMALLNSVQADYVRLRRSQLIRQSNRDGVSSVVQEATRVAAIEGSSQPGPAGSSGFF